MNKAEKIVIRLVVEEGVSPLKDSLEAEVRKYLNLPVDSNTPPTPPEYKKLIVVADACACSILERKQKRGV
jgi:hypothetical protein